MQMGKVGAKVIAFNVAVFFQSVSCISREKIQNGETSMRPTGQGVSPLVLRAC